MDLLRGLLASALTLALASPAAAHLGLRHPPSRYGDNVLKVGPCGVAGGSRSDQVTVLEPGASIDVAWDEYIDHPGHFRVSFDVDGDDDFVDPACSSGCTTRSPVVELYSNAAVLLDGIADTPSGGESGARVTLPDVECDGCTLQVIQVMYDKPPYVTPGDDIYYQCADLVLRRAAASTQTPTASATPTMSPPATPSASPTPSPSRLPSPTRTCDIESAACSSACVGDCDGSGAVDASELRSGVSMALGIGTVGSCLARFDRNTDDAVTVEELVAASSSREGCPSPPA